MPGNKQIPFDLSERHRCDLGCLVPRPTWNEALKCAFPLFFWTSKISGPKNRKSRLYSKARKEKKKKHQEIETGQSGAGLVR